VKTGWSQDQVLSTLSEDAQARYSRPAAPDLVFITGDVAFSGKADEYVLAEDFIRELSEKIHVPRDRFFVVPGNHDIDRDREEDAYLGARTGLVDTLQVDRFLENEGRRKTMFARQMAFREFVNRLTPSKPVYTPFSHAHTRLVNLGAIRAKVLLLDSAWLASGGSGDVGNLLIGERQVLDCGAPDDGNLTFALVHHPFSWLREFEQIALENLIAERAQICLRGHVHSPDTRTSSGPRGYLTMFTAGAAFVSRTSDNTYLWCSANLMTGIGEQIVHHYNHPQHRWDAGSKESWHLPPSVSRVLDVPSIYRDLASVGVPYCAYISCLVAELKSEVPVTLPDGRGAFVACTTRLPGTQNLCGELIEKIRNHFYWRSIWNTGDWNSALRSLSLELAEAVRAVDRWAGDEMRERDAAAPTLLGALSDAIDVRSAPCEEIGNLLGQGDVVRAREVLDRWLASGVLRPIESEEMSRLEVLLLLAEERPSEAMSRADALVSSPARRPGDLALAARAAMDAKQFHKAAELMHSALDAMVPIEDVRTIALRIAGAAGDSHLVQRVRL